VRARLKILEGAHTLLATPLGNRSKNIIIFEKKKIICERPQKTFFKKVFENNLTINKYYELNQTNWEQFLHIQKKLNSKTFFLKSKFFMKKMKEERVKLPNL